MGWTTRRRERKALRAQDRAQEAWSAPRTAFVLSGGGVLGAVQVGQLKALIEARIIPDLVVGCSVGALNAAMVAHDPTLEAMRTLESIWTGLRAEDIFPGSRVARVWNIVARGDHIHSNDGIRKLIEKLPVREFEQLKIPLHVCATEFSTGSERWFERGPLMRAILASTALPGVYPPVLIDGALYVDGGVVNNVPISRAAELGARRIYVLTCGAPNQRSRPIHRPIDVLIQSFSHARSVRMSLDIERYKDQAEIIILPVFDTGFVRYNDPTRSAALIARAEQMTREFLAQPAEEEA
ncbi:MAG: patatin-like phospholipase family protein [Actinomycetota bacterium]